MSKTCRPVEGPPQLTVIALERLACCIGAVHTLTCKGSPLPEELACSLFALVLDKGKLTPKVLDMFEALEHDTLLQQISELNIHRWTPPLLPTSRNGPLGYSRPAWE